MIGWFIGTLVVITGSLFLGYLWITTPSRNKTQRLSWERPEFSRIWHHVSPWPDLYLCGKPRAYYESPAEHTNTVTHSVADVQICRGCASRSKQQGDEQ